MLSRRRKRTTALCGSFIMASLVVGMTGCASCCPKAPKREVAEGVYPVVYAKVAPKIDGVLDDEVWKQATPLTRFYVYQEFGKRVDIATAYLAWDKDNLYFAIDVKDKDLYATEKENDKTLCTADVAELFVKPSDDHLDLYEFEFNFWGAIWYIHYLGRGGGGDERFTVKDHPGIVCKATYRGTPNDPSDVDDGYTIEVAIPLTTFERAAPGGPKPGDRWKFNAAGYDYSVYREDTLLFSSCDGNTKGFAEYEIYPTLVFMAP